MALSLAACGTKSTPAASAAAGSAASGSAASGSGKVYNVCNLVNGNLGDKSFFDSAEAGLKKLESDGRIKLTTIEMGGTDEDQPKWLSTLYEVSDSGEYDLIVCGTYQMPDYLNEVAAKYPDQKYLIYDSAVDQPNVVNINYKQNDLGYLVGVLAASTTTDTSLDKINADKVIGFVGGVDSPVINDFLYGFILGAQSVVPDIKVDTRYTNDYVDTAIAKEYGLSMYIIKYLLNSHLADKSKGQIQTYEFQSQSLIPQMVNNGSKLSWGFAIALAFVVLTALFMYRTRWGYAIRMIGINKDFAMYSGIKVGGVIVLSQVLGGMLAGMGGGLEMLGRYNTYSWSALPGYGWTGITVAILAGNNPIFVPLAAFFMAYLDKGCSLMSTYSNVPSQLIDIIQAVIFLFFAAEQFLSHYRQKLVVKSTQEEMKLKEAAASAAEGSAK